MTGTDTPILCDLGVWWTDLVGIFLLCALVLCYRFYIVMQQSCYNIAALSKMNFHLSLNFWNTWSNRVLYVHDLHACMRVLFTDVRFILTWGSLLYCFEILLNCHIWYIYKIMTPNWKPMKYLLFYGGSRCRESIVWCNLFIVLSVFIFLFIDPKIQSYHFCISLLTNPKNWFFKQKYWYIQCTFILKINVTLKEKLTYGICLEYYHENPTGYWSGRNTLLDFFIIEWLPLFFLLKISLNANMLDICGNFYEYIDIHIFFYFYPLNTYICIYTIISLGFFFLSIKTIYIFLCIYSLCLNRFDDKIYFYWCIWNPSLYLSVPVFRKKWWRLY